MRALLGQVGGREVEDDMLGRQRQADRGHGGAHPLAAFAHGLVGQPHHDGIRNSGPHAGCQGRTGANRMENTALSLVLEDGTAHLMGDGLIVIDQVDRSAPAGGKGRHNRVVLSEADLAALLQALV